MKYIKFKIFPKDWVRAYNILRILINLNSLKVIKILSLMLLVTSMEAVSLALIMPLLELINNDKEIISYNSNFFTEYIFQFFNFIGFPAKFLYISILITLVVFMRQYLNFFLSKVLANLRADSNKVLRKKIFESTFLSTPYTIEELGSGSYIELMTNQSGKAASYLVYLIKYVSILLLSFFYLLIALIIAPAVTFFALLIAIILLFFSNFIISKIKDITKNNVKDLKFFSKYLAECFSSWKVIKLANSYRYENHRNDYWVNQIADQDFQVELNLAKSTLFISVVIMMLLMIVLNVGVNITSMELSILVMFSIMCLRLLPIMLSLVSIQTRITVAAESLKRLFRVLSNLKNNRELDLGHKKMKMTKGIFFENISFKYLRTNKYVFKKFTNYIPLGKVTTITGNSGSGKSTLLDLISRMYDKYEGKISIDNTPINEIDLIEYRKNISLLPQNPFVFDDTVISNIGYGYEKLNKKDIIKAAKLANAHDFISKLSNGYNTILGERGSKISGGQMQRIVLARILASKAKVIILDEPTSSLDQASAKKIIDALIKIKKTLRYTLVIVSHEKKIIELGDKVITIKQLD